MKILLVNPPIPAAWYNDEFYLPSSLLYLGAQLQKNGDDVKILDLKAIKIPRGDASKIFYDKTLLDTISKFEPDLIGFGCLFSGNFPDALRLSKLCKENFGDIPIVAGGIHFTIYAEEILENCSSIDWIALGEAEETLVELVNKVKERDYNFSGIQRFAYRKNGKVVVNPGEHYISDPDAIPFPAYDLVNLKDYYTDTSFWHNPKNMPINTSIPIITSRSCPNQCPFCSMYMAMGPRWRARSPRNVVDEMEFLYNKYDHRHFSIMDDNFSLVKSRVIEICSLIKKRKLDLQFETPNGLSLKTLDREVIDAMASAGLVRVSLAIESGSDYIRNTVMRKNLDRKKIFEITEIIKEYKSIFTNAFFIIGMPEETKKTLMDTYDMMKEIDVDKVHLMNIVPLPSTSVYEQALRDNLLVDLDPKSIYKADDLYFKNYDRFFIKPYKLELADLSEFRIKCMELMDRKNSRKKIRI